ncbi:hypothetical protein NXS19_011637 [Fusarium pseudograminearum]|nr:hypothetical protein NXS19_011637 [Fusarium pseudograminearum]
MGSSHFLIEAAHRISSRISSRTRNWFQPPVTPLPPRRIPTPPLSPLPISLQRSNPDLHNFVSCVNELLAINERIFALNDELIANHRKYKYQRKWFEIMRNTGSIMGYLCLLLVLWSPPEKRRNSRPVDAT